MKKLIVANWKMNPVSQKEAKEIFSALGGPALGGDAADVVVCPPFVYLSAISAINKGLILGAQNAFYEDKGAFTGEISPVMIKDLGADYVILGHSERRKYFGETDEIINKKIKKVLETGLKVIFCIGETEAERDAGKKNEVLEKQIKQGLDKIDDFKNINIAYEPVWAIGTGKNCGIEETKKAFALIRQFVPKTMRILYGGSVKSENSGSYIKEAGANGLLVGGASLIPEEFIKIVKSAE